MALSAGPAARAIFRRWAESAAGRADRGKAGGDVTGVLGPLVAEEVESPPPGGIGDCPVGRLSMDRQGVYGH